MMADIEQAGGAGGEGTRERWPGRFSFIMAAIGSAVGLGNVWRFPYVAYKHGGGAFFIPYFVALLTAGIPLLILEFSVGQMMQGSAPKSLKKLNRNFEWVGWFALLVATLISIYYAAIMAYAWNYLWDSFSVNMPWSAGGEGTEGSYFFDEFLEFTTEPGKMWGLRLSVVAGLALTWLAVFFIIYKGVSRVGKIVLITVPLPWIILVVLAIRGLTLEGASSGVEYYLRPDWAALTRPSTWLAAYGQIFFSLTIGFGVMIAYASYRPRKADVTNNAFIISFANCLTSFIAGFAVFSVLGFLAFKRGVPVDSVVQKSVGLAFVTYPAAITKMGDLHPMWPPLVGILFFTALLTLGIDSLFSLVEAAGAGFHDRFPKVKRVHLTAAICGGAFVLGLLFATRGGLGWLDVIDHWANDYGLAIVGLLQCLLVGYFFHTHRIRDFADDVSEIKLSGWWELCVKVITPVVLVYLIGQNLMTEFAEPYGAADYRPLVVWTARVLFLLLFAAAFMITRHWSYIALAGIALVLGLVSYGLVRPASVEIEAERAALSGGEAQQVSFGLDTSGMDEPYVARWHFGDGKTSIDLAPVHTYGKPGTYKASVAVTGSGGRGRTARADLEVAARPIEITDLKFQHKTSRGVKKPLVFGYEAKADYGKEPYAYRWDFGDGETSDAAEGEHVYAKPGTYTVKLTAADSSAWKPPEASKEKEIVVLPFSVDLRVDHAGGETPVVVTFSATPYDKDGSALDADGFAFEWGFGDGDTSGERSEVKHRYDIRGKLTRTSRALADGTVQVVVDEAAPPKEFDDGPFRTVKATVTVTRRGHPPVTESVDIHLRPPEAHFPGRAALLSAVGGMLLIGGLALCVLVAMKHHRKSPPGFEEEALG